MKNYNVIVVLNKTKDKMLMCKREKDPYKGLYNLVGGKEELGEDETESAYRELFEETGISKDDINLNHMMDFNYHNKGFNLKVFAGKLNKDVNLVREVNELEWLDVNSDLCDETKFAGEGNIHHMLRQIDLNSF